jgi:ferrous iron transport protein A
MAPEFIGFQSKSPDFSQPGVKCTDLVFKRTHTMSKHTNSVPLVTSRAGQWLRIISMPKDGSFSAKFIRVGIDEGAKVQCLERLPGGTIVLRKNRQQIAVGHQLAKQIMVAILAGEEEHSSQ